MGYDFDERDSQERAEVFIKLDPFSDFNVFHAEYEGCLWQFNFVIIKIIMMNTIMQ